MALRFHVRHFSRVQQRGEKVAKVTFRGVPQYTRIVEESGEDVIFDEVLEWPVGRCVEPGEEVQVQLQAYNKYFSNRSLANYGFVLQRLVGEGAVVVTDHMTDANNKLVKILISFEARYIPPPGGGREGRRRRHSGARAEEDVFGGGDGGEGSLGGEGGGIEGGRGLERGRGGGGGIEGGRGGPERGRAGGGAALDRGGGGPFWDGDLSSDAQDGGGGYGSELEDDKQMLLDVEQNIANLERNISMQEKHSGMVRGRKSKENSPEMQKKSVYLSECACVHVGKHIHLHI
ncbi:otoferlin-like [Penaeus vannamei]|uniref:otoferlin-like n=1 Tax=Penaeus vannamei TaxID=6689 RepID=UPI00387FA2D2